MTDHPRAERLEALAAGDEDVTLSAHLASCAECRSHVAELRAASVEFGRRAPSPLEFAQQVSARAASPAFTARRSHGRLVFAAAPALALVAALVLVVRARIISPPTTPLPAAPSSQGGAGVRFKGSVPLAVIRERAGEQARFVGKVGVRPGDALRLEVSLDVERPLTAGLLSEDGTFLELIAPQRLAPGTHFSELAARFDVHPTPGWLVAGEPEAIDRARRSRAFEGTSAIRVELEP